MMIEDSNIPIGDQRQPPSSGLPDANDDIDYMRRLLGGAFVDWVLAKPDGTPTPAQLVTASGLAEILRHNISAHPETPIEHIIPILASYHKASGTTLINHARQCAGGTSQSVEGVPGDRLLSAFRAFAIECYGEMLLPAGPFRGSGPDFHNYVKARSGKDLIDAILAEGIFPTGADVDYSGMDSDTAAFFRSVIPGTFASGLVRCAWRLAKLRHEAPSLDQLLEQVPIAVKQLRSFLRGKPTAVTAVASLTGACLPPDVEISGPWGRIRSARPEDHPPAVRHLIDKRTTTTTEAGDHIEISDAGDIIIEASVRVKFEMGKDGNSWTAGPVDDFGDMLDRIRLAFTLAVARPEKPVIYCMWSTTLFPTGHVEPRPFTDPNFMAMRVPTLLSGEEIVSWGRWINIIMAADMAHLKVAMTRTLRAMAERRDPYDRLIDAVIAWESLFGGDNELAFRISASLARLLHSSGQDRETAQKNYSKIYGARSRIVHGSTSKTKTQQAEEDRRVQEYGRTAIDVSLKAMACILTTHRDLLALESQMRSTRILLGADRTDTSGDSS
jgi:hypothetical protein